MFTHEMLAEILADELSYLLYKVPSKAEMYEHVRMAHAFVKRNDAEVATLMAEMNARAAETGELPNRDLVINPLLAKLREEAGGDAKYRRKIPPPY